MKRFWPLLAAVASLVLVVNAPMALAAVQSIILAPGDSLTVTCSTQLSGTSDANKANFTCAAPPTPTPTPTNQNATPVAGQLCPQWVHDQYAAPGPDGNNYRTWHPPVDPQYGCYFGHEHGADPRTSHAFTAMPPFGYAAQTVGMTEPHTGYKVFMINQGDLVESNAGNKYSTEDVMFVFHQGTAGVGRYTQEFHSFQLDYIDRSGSGASAHLSGLADTGATNQDSSTCANPRKGGKDFSTLGCHDTYEIWNDVHFQILYPGEDEGITGSRFGMATAFAVFDPITTRDPADNNHLVYSQDVKSIAGHVDGIPASSPQASFLGCSREFYSGPLFFTNAGKQTIYYTDAYGRVSEDGANAQHPIKQQLSATSVYKTNIMKQRASYCGNNIQAPN